MDFNPTIRRSRRKTFSIEIRRDGTLLVRAPLRATSTQIELILQQKKDWIHKKLGQLNAAQAAVPPRRWIDGEEFYFLGQSYPLRVVEAGNRPVDLKDEVFQLLRSAQPKARQVFEQWYRAQARKVINERVALYSEQKGFVYQQVRIGGARTRWGSCGARGTLNFTWRLAMAPVRVIDYVVVHELVHLEIKNHGKDFWQKVRSLMPDYQERAAWLKASAQKLTL